MNSSVDVQCPACHTFFRPQTLHTPTSVFCPRCGKNVATAAPDEGAERSSNGVLAILLGGCLVGVLLLCIVVAGVGVFFLARVERNVAATPMAAPPQVAPPRVPSREALTLPAEPATAPAASTPPSFPERVPESSRERSPERNSTPAVEPPEPAATPPDPTREPNPFDQPTPPTPTTTPPASLLPASPFAPMTAPRNATPSAPPAVPSIKPPATLPTAPTPVTRSPSETPPAAGPGARPLGQPPLPPRPQAPAKPVLPDDEITQALADAINPSAEFFVRHQALLKLANAAPVDARRAEVVDGVLPVTTDKNFALSTCAVRAVGAWAGKEQVAALIKLLDDAQGVARHQVFLAIGESRVADEQLARKLVGRLFVREDLVMAYQALRSQGSVAEDALLEALQQPNRESQLDFFAFLLLRESGGPKSVDALKKMLESNPDSRLTSQINSCLRTVESRLAKPPAAPMP